MKINFIRFLAIILSVAMMISFVSCGNVENPSDKSPNEDDDIKDTEIFDKMQSVFLIGQSNMAGRGELKEVEAINDDRIFMIRDGKFVKMQEPIHDDKPDIAGVGLGASFAKAFVGV